jgi:Ser/Thr protein kinase RdoA (MazF antagonist)
LSSDWNQIRAVMDQFGQEFRPRNVTPLGNAGGFSGARLWKLLPAGGEALCLRQWPAEHPGDERLQTIHQLLLHVAQQGFDLVPCPLADMSGNTIVRHAERYWELTPWMPGSASYARQPSLQKIVAAQHALARFHELAASFSSPQLGQPPGAQERHQLLRYWLAGTGNTVRNQLPRIGWPELAARAVHILDGLDRLGPHVLNELASVQEGRVPLQFCLRDIWHENVLFEQDQVTAILDFGAVRVESPAADIARLLGSMAQDDTQWQHGLKAYEQTRRLTDAERSLAATYRRSGTLLAPLNWLKWIVVEGRQFDDRPAVLRRVDELLTHLDRFQAGFATNRGPIVQ